VASKLLILNRHNHLLLVFRERSEQLRISVPGKMKFRPCIDLHAGQVKQIVGGTLRDGAESETRVNFASQEDAASFAVKYRRDGLQGGHVIMLGPGNEEQALAALKTFPGGLHLGGGVNPSNAQKYLDAGASHVIVTSYVFKDGSVNLERLQELVSTVGKDKLVLDLSCRQVQAEDGESKFFVVTDRWQKFTDLELNEENLKSLSKYCAEFLVHAVDVEGLQVGVMGELVALLGNFSPIPVTYAGGARSLDDFEMVKLLGQGNVDLTIGSALDIFGGNVPYQTVVKWHYANLFRDEIDLTSLPEPKLRNKCITAKASLLADQAAEAASQAFEAALHFY